MGLTRMIHGTLTIMIHDHHDSWEFSSITESQEKATTNLSETSKKQLVINACAIWMEENQPRDGVFYGSSHLVPCPHQNCWDLWIFIALTIVTLWLCQKIAIEAMAQSK